VFICVYPWLLPAGAFAQQEAAQEVAANLAEGRVVVCAAKDGIIVATVDAHSELGSRPPAVVALSAFRAGVLLGAVEWVQPESSDKPIRLDSELPHLAGAALNPSGRPNYENAASDIEAMGVALLERVRQLAGQLHNKINIGEDEPLIRLVLVGYVPNYGPEAWTVDYHIRQDALGNDYWRTRVLRPSYNQLYPPEKGQPHTFVEVRFPPESRATQSPDLIDLLRQDDPKLAAIRTSSKQVEKAITFVTNGQSEKSAGDDDATFLRAAIPAIAPAQAKITIGQIDFDKGFRWLVEPADHPPAGTKPQEQEPGAPTLRQKRN